MFKSAIFHSTNKKELKKKSIAVLSSPKQGGLWTLFVFKWHVVGI
jgi:hypothetical protein